MMRELTVRIDGAQLEAFSDALVASGALAVSIEDADAGSPQEQAIYDEPGAAPAALGWARSRVTILIDANTDGTRLLQRAAVGILPAPPPIDSEREVSDVDWVRATQSQFGPIRIGRLCILPSWHDPPSEDALVIRLDPGVAFGTGTHPTTRLCLRWLDAHPPRSLSVLDYGCGSGILALAAAKLGAAIVAATDIDPQAVAAARANAAANGVEGIYTEPGALPAQPFDVVLANILTNPLKALAPTLAARLAVGGTLVLSGILERQANEVIFAYARQGLRTRLWAVEDGWVCLTATRAQ
ncbi:MAG: 50S ribosomal protein L11 methyltransferase [Burkholderiaceae bacterium]|nr:50S ribosomal protein L11 methyltransferase [Burkholderiaceae bacterium]